MIIEPQEIAVLETTFLIDGWPYRISPVYDKGGILLYFSVIDWYLMRWHGDYVEMAQIPVEVAMPSVESRMFNFIAVGEIVRAAEVENANNSLLKLAS